MRISFKTERSARKFVSDMDERMGLPNVRTKTRTCSRPKEMDDGWYVRVTDAMEPHLNDRERKRLVG